jgi:predicted O-methyltransferase YrrM
MAMDPRYWARAARALARHATTPNFGRELLTAGLREDARPKAPTRSFLEAFPDAEGREVRMGTVAFRASNLDPLEQYVVAVLCKLRRPQRIFEIGTYDGATTLLLARNAPTAEVFTLDLPPDHASVAAVTSEVANAREGAGRRFTDSPEAEQITQLYGDSRTFDFSPWHRDIDLILVDGGHDYDCARADTANALRMVRVGGLVIWDDYLPGWPGVVSAVDDCGRPVTHLAATGLAVYDARATQGQEQPQLPS